MACARLGRWTTHGALFALFQGCEVMVLYDDCMMVLYDDCMMMLFDDAV